MANMDKWPDKMRKAGFKDVAMQIVKVLTNPWPKDPKQKVIGRYMQYEQEEGWIKEEIDVLLAHVVTDLRDESIHQYAKAYLVYGRKP